MGADTAGGLPPCGKQSHDMRTGRPWQCVPADASAHRAGRDGRAAERPHHDAVHARRVGASRRRDRRARDRLRAHRLTRAGERSVARRRRGQVHIPPGHLELGRLGRHGLQFELEQPARHRPELAAERCPDPGRDHRAKRAAHHRQGFLRHVLQHASERPADG